MAVNRFGGLEMFARWNQGCNRPCTCSLLAMFASIAANQMDSFNVRRRRVIEDFGTWLNGLAGVVAEFCCDCLQMLVAFDCVLTANSGRRQNRIKMFSVPGM